MPSAGQHVLGVLRRRDRPAVAEDDHVVADLERRLGPLVDAGHALVEGQRGLGTDRTSRREAEMADYQTRRTPVLAASEAYIRKADRGEYAPIYRFGEAQITEEHITITPTEVRIDGLANAIQLPAANPYEDMTR